MASNTALSSTSFNAVNSNLIELTKKYFGVDNINTSKNTFLAYFIETMSNTIADTNLSAAFLFNEQMINSAKFKSNILKKARDYNYIGSRAFPAYIETIVYVELTDDELTSTTGNLSILNLKDRDLKFINNGLVYSLLGDIVIRKVDLKYKVEIDTSKLALPIYNASNMHLELTSSIVPIANKPYLAFSTELAQVEIQYKEHYVSDRVFKTYSSIEFEMADGTSLYDLNIYLYENGNKIYLTETTIPFLGTDRFGYYFGIEEINDSKYAIILDNGINSKFIVNGTKLYIEIYGTNGSKGYVSKPVFTVQTDNSISLNRDLKSSSPYVSTKGVDELSGVDLKRDVIRYIQSPLNKTVVTKFDIKNVLERLYLNNITMADIIMRRNDPIERVLELYTTIISDDKLSFLGTNTLPVKVDESYLAAHNGVIKPGVILKVEPSGSPQDGATIETSLYPNKYNYTTNYNTEIITAPTIMASITKLNFFNKDFDVYENLNNSSLLNIDLYCLKVYIDNSTPNEHKFIAIFFSSDANAVKDILNSNPTIASDMKFRIIFENPSNTEDDFYIDLAYDNTSPEALASPYIHMTATILTNGEIHSNKLNYISGVTKTGSGSANPYILNKYESIKSYLYFEDRDPLIIDPNKIENKGALGDYLSVPSNANNYTVVTREELTAIDIFFTNLTEFFKIAVDKNESTGVYTLKNMPLFCYEDYFNPDNSSLIYNVQLEYLELYKNIKEVVEMPSVMAVKFRNTYGINENYTINYLDGTTEKSSRLKLNIEITRSSGSAMMTPDKFDTIREAIMRLINRNTDRNIYISDIVDEVQKSIPNLIQVRIININDNIIYKPTMDINNDYPEEYIPSTINIIKSDINIVQKDY